MAAEAGIEIECLHYYFYFVDEDPGLCHLRVPTWLPRRLQICFNGHNWLAGQLRKLGIDYRMADNAFSHIADWQRAQRISNGWEAKRIHARLDEFARRCYGSRETKWASMQKTIYSLPTLRDRLEAANRGYLEFLSAFEDPRAGKNKLDKLSQPVEQEGAGYSGFNLFDPDDENLLCSIVRGEFNISGLQNKTLRRHLSELGSGQVSRLLKRLRTHGLQRNKVNSPFVARPARW